MPFVPELILYCCRVSVLSKRSPSLPKVIWPYMNIRDSTVFHLNNLKCLMYMYKSSRRTVIPVKLTCEKLLIITQPSLSLGYSNCSSGTSSPYSSSHPVTSPDKIFSAVMFSPIANAQAASYATPAANSGS